MTGESEGVSTRYLLAGFFAVVLLCAVFFSLGYFLGYREGHPGGTPLTQQVAASSEVPAPVNSSEGAAPASEPASAGQSAPSSDTQAPASVTASPVQNGTAASDNPPAQPPAGSPTAAAATTETQQPVSTISGSAAPPSEAPAATGADQLTPTTVPSGLLIQVGAVRGREEASQIAETLRSSGYHALVLTPTQVGAGDSFFRVVAGPYKSRASAEAALKKLTREGYKPFIRQ